MARQQREGEEKGPCLTEPQPVHLFIISPFLGPFTKRRRHRVHRLTDTRLTWLGWRVRSPAGGGTPIVADPTNRADNQSGGVGFPGVRDRLSNDLIRKPIHFLIEREVSSEGY